MVTGDLEECLRSASASFSYSQPNLALAGGGPAVTDGDMVASVERLQEVARRLAPSTAYSFVSSPSGFGLFTGSHSTPIPDRRVVP